MNWQRYPKNKPVVGKEYLLRVNKKDWVYYTVDIFSNWEKFENDFPNFDSEITHWCEIEPPKEEKE